MSNPVVISALRPALRRESSKRDRLRGAATAGGPRKASHPLSKGTGGWRGAGGAGPASIGSEAGPCLPPARHRCPGIVHRARNTPPRGS